MSQDAKSSISSKNKDLFKKLVKVQLTENEKEAITEKNFTEKENSRVSNMLSSVSNSNVGDIIKKLQPIFDFFMSLVDVLSPLVNNGINAATTVYNLLPMQILYALVGLVLAFFGGTFAVSIAAFEAFYLTGYSTVSKNVKYLYGEFTLLWKKSREDDELDENNDGVKDVLQLSVKGLISRKVSFFFSTCSDPNMLLEVVYSLFESLLAIIAVLKVQFAKVIALGATIGDNIRKPASYIFVPILSTVLPSKFHKWIAPLINFCCKVIAITIAWYVQKVISSVQSAIRGGLMFSRRLLAFLNEKGYFNIKEEDTYLDEIFGWLVAGIGIYFQLSNFLGLPFPLNLLLAPISLLENTLIWIISE